MLVREEQHGQHWTPDGVWSTPVINGRSRQALELNLTQRLGDLGSLSLNGSRRTYWDLADDQRSVALSYSATVRQVSYSLGYMLSAWPGSDRRDDRQISLNIQLPLQDWLMGRDWPHSLWTNYGMTHDNRGRTAHTAGLGGTLLDDNRLSWGSVSLWCQGQIRRGSDSTTARSTAATAADGVRCLPATVTTATSSSSAMACRAEWWYPLRRDAVPVAGGHHGPGPGTGCGRGTGGEHHRGPYRLARVYGHDQPSALPAQQGQS